MIAHDHRPSGRAWRGDRGGAGSFTKSRAPPSKRIKREGLALTIAYSNGWPPWSPRQDRLNYHALSSNPSAIEEAISREQRRREQ
jgi:hypothetical protein